MRRFGEVHCRFVVQDTLEISGADGTQTSLPLEDIDIVRMAKEDEGAFKPVGCTFRVTIEESEGVKVTHTLSTGSAEERRSWVQLLAAARAPQLFKECAVGPSAQYLFELSEGPELVAAREKLRLLTVEDVQKMIHKGPTQNKDGRASELGDGSWSVQVLLPFGRLTWANIKAQDDAPTAEQLHTDWLQP